MFGYIKPDIGDLKVRQLELYRSVYCGICETGGKTVSRLTRFMLSYDFVFLAILRLAITKEKYSFKDGRCIYNPLKKKKFMTENEALRYTSSAFGVLAYYNFRDDINDSKQFGKFIRYIALPFFSKMKKRALKTYPELDDMVKKPLEELSEIEKNIHASPDEAADCFARLTGAVLSYGLTGADARIAESCGYHLGRYIYLADACDDFKKDFKSGSFNPLRAVYGTPEEMFNDPSLMNSTLSDSMNAFLLSYGLAEPPDSSLNAVIENIAVLGTQKIQEQIFTHKNVMNNSVINNRESKLRK